MKTFQKIIEDFTCENCGQKVKGNGYTNHCPACLFSKHLDESPGDRLSLCGGQMVPVEIITRKQEHLVKHRCVVCRQEKINQLSPQDDFSAVLQIIKDNELKNRRSSVRV